MPITNSKKQRSEKESPFSTQVRLATFDKNPMSFFSKNEFSPIAKPPRKPALPALMNDIIEEEEEEDEAEKEQPAEYTIKIKFETFTSSPTRLSPRTSALESISEHEDEVPLKSPTKS